MDEIKECDLNGATPSLGKQALGQDLPVAAPLFEPTFGGEVNKNNKSILYTASPSANSKPLTNADYCRRYRQKKALQQGRTYHRRDRGGLNYRKPKTLVYKISPELFVWLKISNA